MEQDCGGINDNVTDDNVVEMESNKKQDYHVAVELLKLNKVMILQCFSKNKLILLNIFLVRYRVEKADK